MSTQTANAQEYPLTGFGPNEWIVEDMYQRFLADPTSVDSAWHEFFADYKPAADAPPGGDGASTPAASTPAPSAAAPAAAAAPAVAPPAPAPAPAKAPAAAVGKAGVTPPVKATALPAGATTLALRGVAAKIVQNMAASLEVPTATSVRAIPAKLIADNRIVINNHLTRGRGGKISFTHMIGYALVKALAVHPELNNSYAEVDGKPVVVIPARVNLGVAIDLPKPDGSRSLVVPSVKGCEAMDFRQFWQAYEDVIRRARRGELTLDDYAGATISLTNPGGIGTVHSQPRLMVGQGAIIGVGAMEYPAPFAGMSEARLAKLAGSGIHVSLIEPGPIVSRFRANAYAAYQRNIDAEHSVHKEKYLAMERRLNQPGPAAPFTLPPEAVLEKVIHALEHPRPKVRYYVTFPTYLFAALKRVLPQRVMDWVLTRASGGGSR